MLHSSYPHSRLHSTITSTNNNLNHDHWITNLHSLLFIVEWSSDGLSDLQSPALTLSSVSCPPIHHVSTRIVLIEWVPINDQSFHQMLGLEPGVELIRSWAYISAPGLIGLTLFLKWLRSALASSSWSLKSTLIPATALHIPAFRSHISHRTHFWAVYTRRWGRQRQLHQLNCYHHSRVKTDLVDSHRHNRPTILHLPDLLVHQVHLVDHPISNHQHLTPCPNSRRTREESTGLALSTHSPINLPATAKKVWRRSQESWRLNSLGLYPSSNQNVSFAARQHVHHPMDSLYRWWVQIWHGLRKYRHLYLGHTMLSVVCVALRMQISYRIVSRICIIFASDVYLLIYLRRRF